MEIYVELFNSRYLSGLVRNIPRTQITLALSLLLVTRTYVPRLYSQGWASASACDTPRACTHMPDECLSLVLGLSAVYGTVRRCSASHATARGCSVTHEASKLIGLVWCAVCTRRQLQPRTFRLVFSFFFFLWPHSDASTSRRVWHNAMGDLRALRRELAGELTRPYNNLCTNEMYNWMRKRRDQRSARGSFSEQLFRDGFALDLASLIPPIRRYWKMRTEKTCGIYYTAKVFVWCFFATTSISLFFKSRPSLQHFFPFLLVHWEK